ncbi:DUF4302 domain-containing protein [Bacteroidales bacterium OttesenSCG-928-M11]|nr:DUF4302 domain-containing protein [Bacteroidales bacterium OttesenSCG-928-M11]
MDKIKILYSLVLALFIFSCAGEEKDIFSDSAANRLTKSINEYNDLLCSSPNGWIFEYFPTTSSVGYIFLARFEQGGFTEVACKNKVLNGGEFLRDSSLFEVIGDNGPVLSFNTFNNIIHKFSEPYDIPSTSDNESGRGYEGDYEFMLISGDKTQINLKGKKRGTRLTLRKLDENQNWENFFTHLDAIEATMFNKGIIPLSLRMPDGNNFNLSFKKGDDSGDDTSSNGYTTEFSVYPEGGDAISQTEKVPFVVTEYGIRLNEPFEEGDYSVQRFKLAEDKSCLVSMENANIKIQSYYSVSDLFFHIMSLSNSSTDYRWTAIDSDNTMSENFASSYKTVKESAVGAKRTLGHVGFNSSTFKSNSSWKHTAVVRLQSGALGSDGMYLFDLEKISDSEIKTHFRGFEDGYSQEILLRNGKTFYDILGGLPELINLMSTNFEITSQTGDLNPSILRFSDKNNKENWFDLEFITQKK